MITYKEFEARVKELDGSLFVRKQPNVLCVESSTATLLVIEVQRTCGIDSSYSLFFKYEHKQALFDLATELAATPIDKRVEQKKYYYRKAWKDDSEDIFYTFLNFNKFSRRIMHSKYDNKESSDTQTQFTKAEYKAIAKEKGIPDGYHIPEEVTE